VPEVRLPYEFSAPLRTARLVLRTMTDDDVDDIYAYQSRADVCAICLWFKGDWGDTAVYAILDREWPTHPP